MPKKTKNSDRNRGQIIKRGEDRYLVRVYVGTVEGRRKYAARVVRGTYRTAERELTKSLREADTGVLVQPTRATLQEYLTTWLDTSKRLEVEPRTLADYRLRLTRDVMPRLGTSRLDRVTRQSIQALYSELDQRGLSPRTIRYTHGILKHALKDAVIQGLLPRNPADHLSLPKKKRREPAVLAAHQVNLLLEMTDGTSLHALWSVLLLGGMRPGEALALKWEDFDGSRLRVVRALKKGAGDAYAIGDTKTEGSRRSIPLDSRAIEALVQHRLRQAKQMLAAGGQFQRLDLIFTNVVGRPLDMAKVRREFKKALASAGLPTVRLYDTRHSHATLLMAAGLNPKIVADRLGHSNISMTLSTYSHVLPDLQESAVRVLEGLNRKIG